MKIFNILLFCLIIIISFCCTGISGKSKVCCGGESSTGPTDESGNENEERRSVTTPKYYRMRKITPVDNDLDNIGYTGYPDLRQIPYRVSENQDEHIFNNPTPTYDYPTATIQNDDPMHFNNLI